MAHRPHPVLLFMDPLTHGLTGAAAAQSLADKEKQRPAAVTAFVAALMPDLEFFIHKSSDPLFHIEVHRQFTHSFVFIPAGALLTAALLWWFLRRRLTFGELFLFSLLGFATHGLLDAATSYGTELLWPFSDARFAWNLLPIVDPILTLGMAGLAIAAFTYRRRLFGWLVFGWLLLWLTAGFVQRERGKSAMEELAAQRGHHIEQLVVKPTIGNLILWRSTYITGDTVRVDAVRAGIIRPLQIYPGDTAPLVVPERDFADWKGTTLYGDILRFQRFSDGYLTLHPDKPEIIGDARYAMIPTSLSPLWGIRADTTRADQHVPFLNFRDAGSDVREEFLRQLRGN